MKVLELLEDFQSKVDATANFPMSKKILLERDEVESLLSNIQTFLPDEMKHAKWIKEEREKILEEASLESEDILQRAKKEEREIIAEAKRQFEQMVTESEVLKEAEERAQELLAQARAEARDVRMNSYQYSEDMMLDLKEGLEGKLEIVLKDLHSLQDFLQK
ncbi:MAG: hypothetical protein GX079_00120 [Tissierellia bacterium]|nr:hypothetical protein [Tissierellia bacterium]